jgi:hypothetical protein
MKAILEFSLPEERQEHMDAINGTHWRSAFEEIDSVLRDDIKYKELPDDWKQALVWVREIMRDAKPEP